MDNKPTPTSQAPPSPSTPEQSDPCPSCGRATTRKMFRTGSVDHPGKDVHVCPECGIRR